MIVLSTSSSSFRQRVLLHRQPRLRGFVYLLRRVEVSFNLSFVLSTHSTCVGLFLPTKLFFNVVRDARGDFGQYGGALLLERTSRPTSLFLDLASSSILHLLCHLFSRGTSIYRAFCLLRCLSSLPLFVCPFDVLSV